MRFSTAHGLIFACSTLSILLACSPTSDPTALGDEDFHAAWITSVSAPRTVSWAEDLVISVRGSAGPDRCHTFERIIVLPKRTHITLSAVARRHGQSSACPPGPAHFETSVTIRGLFSENFVIVALQPDGSSLETRVRVRP
jgi:hypothetical protein